MAGADASFGQRLRRLRETAGLTQEQLAERAGLSAKAVAALERGRRERPYPHTVRALADALGLSDEEREPFTRAVPDRTRAPEVDPERRAGVPVPPNLLLGREQELSEVVGLLCARGARLVTLTGPGGVGKTRLALEVAALLSRRLTDGAAFVTLAALDEPALVVPMVVQALGLSEISPRTPRDMLAAYLAGKTLLLVLDNFEHVLPAAAEIADLLAASPGLLLLVTSRAPLRIRSEREYPIGPLALPDPRGAARPDELARSAAARLFVARAQASVPDFQLTAANASAVASICRRLDGLPLALELAAARLRLLSAGELLARLDRVLPLLTAGARDLPQRQQTMRGTIDWSYQLLHATQRALFRQLSVFAGGWDLEAAERIGAGENMATEEMLDLLCGLVEQSLVVAERRSGGTTRYRMLEPVREYARERLEEQGEAPRTRQRHADYYLALVEVAAPQLRGPQQITWLDRLEQENDNLRAAITWALSVEEPDMAARLGWHAHLFWWLRGHQSEGRRYLEQILTRRHALSTDALARALAALGALLYGHGDPKRMLAVFAESARLFEQVGDSFGQAYTLGGVGLAAQQLGDLEGAVTALQHASELNHQMGDPWMITQTSTYLGLIFFHQGDYPRAAHYQEEALQTARATADHWGMSLSAYNLALMAEARGEHDRAAQLFRESLLVSKDIGHGAHVAYCLEGLASLATTRGEPLRAARLFGAAEALLETLGKPHYVHISDRSMTAILVAALRLELGEHAFASAWAEGWAMRPEHAIAYALDAVV